MKQIPWAYVAVLAAVVSVGCRCQAPATPPEMPLARVQSPGLPAAGAHELQLDRPRRIFVLYRNTAGVNVLERKVALWEGALILEDGDAGPDAGLAYYTSGYNGTPSGGVFLRGVVAMDDLRVTAKHGTVDSAFRFTPTANQTLAAEKGFQVTVAPKAAPAVASSFLFKPLFESQSIHFDGADGRAGKEGAEGKPGSEGTEGRRGRDGDRTGQDGSDGGDGWNGTDGERGRPGRPGEPGEDAPDLQVVVRDLRSPFYADPLMEVAAGSSRGDQRTCVMETRHSCLITARGGDGGSGGAGGPGGPGGDGGKGGDGGDGADGYGRIDAGDGGDGGDGGRGGDGGDGGVGGIGGPGGDGGVIAVAYRCPAEFFRQIQGQIDLICSGGSRGRPGPGGKPGPAGSGGRPGSGGEGGTGHGERSDDGHDGDSGDWGPSGRPGQEGPPGSRAGRPGRDGEVRVIERPSI